MTPAGRRKSENTTAAGPMLEEDYPLEMYLK